MYRVGRFRISASNVAMARDIDDGSTSRERATAEKLRRLADSTKRESVLRSIFATIAKQMCI